MVRTQIQLPEKDYDRIRDLARRSGISLAEMIRRCVADRLAADAAVPTREERVEGALAVCGKYDDLESSEVAENHDAHLADAFALRGRDV